MKQALETVSRALQSIRHSIQWKLGVGFTLASALLAAIAGATVFYDTYHETHELQDDLLQQIASYVPHSGAWKQAADSENDARIFVYSSKNPPSSSIALFLQQKSEGFYNLTDDDEPFRAYVHETEAGKILVMQETEYREDLASRSAWASVWPILLFLPLMLLLIVWVVRKNMRPIHRLSQAVSQRTEQDLTPLPTQNIPSEVVGFVSAINLLLDKAGRFMQQQKRFIADASHELRSPMTALSLQVENLQQLPLSDEAKAQVAQIQQGIQRNRHLLEQLLSLARLQNTSGAERHRVDVNAVFRQVIEAVLPLAADKDIGVVSSSNVNVMGEEMDFYLLIKTLVDNAVSYTPASSQIDLSVEETENAWLIHVEDNGCGIAAAERERVLEPFYRVLGTRQQGSGLGLSIAQEIVRKYHGSLQLCDSRHFEHGLWVRIELPKT